MWKKQNKEHKKENEDKQWRNLLAQDSKETAEMWIKGRDGEEEVAFTGMGYFDHNQGAEPMKESFKDWYWGRFISSLLRLFIISCRNTMLSSLRAGS